MAKDTGGGAAARDDGDPVPGPRGEDGRLSLLVELRASVGMTMATATNPLRSLDDTGFEIDEDFAPVPLGGGGPGLGMASAASPSHLVRVSVADESAIDAVRARPEVAAAWWDTPIGPFACPIPPCDCDPATPRGTIADVASYLGVTDIWAAGHKGAGMVVGVVDGGITAQGRPVIAGETSRRIPRVIGGWPTADWGTRASAWGEHGNMCATDVLGMAPEAQIYDLRISGAPSIPSTISKALQAFQWAIDQHRIDGTPQVLSNSWGIFQESWDATYARDPNHPFTRKVLEAIDEGILVLFAAGNCGGTCPDGRCGPDSGPGRSIWGANSHQRVMTVGAVNRHEEFVGYSSQGPGALHADKPDFCSVTHFTGYFPSDSGTSAATPILAGCVALIKQARPWASQAQVLGALRATAKDIGPSGFDQHSGAGIVRPKAALDRLQRIVGRPSLAIRCTPTSPVVCAIPTTTVRGCIRPTLTPACLKVTVICHTTPVACVPRTVSCRTVACQPDWERVPQPVAGADPAWEGWYGDEGADDGYGDEERWTAAW